ncbi:SET domain-containing protein 4 [Caerostris darwini]|uniref:SET domain-containing protein 4 n=1 Tax=Caerostris darwini TaxID=1538125 RepID=A0AAV4RGZ8_9ARAC|nr:SET domain-containing protein 4 [Caerostris darwini]
MRNCKGRTFRKRKEKKLLLASMNSENECQNDRKFNLLCKWMGENGYKPCKKLKPYNFHDTGRGLLTKEKICTADTIIRIPQNLLITSYVVLISELGPFLKRYCPKASGHQILSVFLMFQKAKEKASEWYSYIETLPLFYNIPAFYGPQCLSMIPNFLYEEAKRQVEFVHKSYDQLKELFTHLKQSFPFINRFVDFNVYKWAWCTVNTRCVFMECFKKNCLGKTCLFHLALAPFLDLLNHNINVQVQAGFNQKTKCYEIISLSEFRKFSQVFINYGSHDSCKLFLEYGFVIPNNNNDYISFSIDDILLAYENVQLPLQLISSKLQFITQNNLIKLWESDQEIDNSHFNEIYKEVLQVKLQQLIKHPVDDISYPSDCYFLQEQISQLLTFMKTILIKAIE